MTASAVDWSAADHMRTSLVEDATLLGAALTPLIAAYLIDRHGETAVTAYLIGLCLLSVGCLVASRETVHESIEPGLVDEPAPTAVR